MKDANLELLNPQSNAGSFLALSMNPWSGNFEVSSNFYCSQFDIIPKTMFVFFILEIFFSQVGDLCLFLLFSTKNPVKPRHPNPRCFTGKLLELPGNTVEGAQENIGRTYDVATFTSVLGRLGDGWIEGWSFLFTGALCIEVDIFCDLSLNCDIQKI